MELNAVVERLDFLFKFLIICAFIPLVYYTYLFFFRGWKDRYFLKFRGAHKLYKNTVLKDKMTYEFFIDNFKAKYSLDGSVKVKFTNDNLKEIGIINSTNHTVLYYLTNYRPVVEKYFNGKNLIDYKSFLSFKQEIIEFDKSANSKEETVAARLETELISTKSILNRPLTDAQFEILAQCANKYNVFYKEVSFEELKNTFNCILPTAAYRLRAASNILLALFLDVLKENKIIIKNYQTFVEDNELFLSSNLKTEKILNRADLTNALTQTGVTGANHSTYEKIRDKMNDSISPMLEEQL
mgnify:FL=1